VSAAAPGIFLSKANRAQAANNQDGTLTVFFTGQGLLDPLLGSGEAPAPGKTYTPLAAITATVGGRPATVVSIGMTPGQVGMAQLTLRMPELAAGDHPLVITCGGTASNSAMVTIGTR
jgi:uncharacterized protein (TIGR03437 family)